MAPARSAASTSARMAEISSGEGECPLASRRRYSAMRPAKGVRGCGKGAGGKFVADGNLISGVGKLPFNTDGGGLCNNHPANRGGMTKVIEAVRQLRGEAHPAVQVKNCNLALAQGTGMQLGTRHCSATLIMERE